MLVFVSRTSDERDEDNLLPQPFPEAWLHPCGEWCIEMPEDKLAGWVETYGPVVACVKKMPNGERAWLLEIYDQPRETSWPKGEAAPKWR
jgi:hypothetical protein